MTTVTVKVFRKQIFATVMNSASYEYKSASEKPGLSRGDALQEMFGSAWAAGTQTASAFADAAASGNYVSKEQLRKNLLAQLNEARMQCARAKTANDTRSFDGWASKMRSLESEMAMTDTKKVLSAIHIVYEFHTLDFTQAWPTGLKPVEVSAKPCKPGEVITAQETRYTVK